METYYVDFPKEILLNEDKPEKEKKKRKKGDGKKTSGNDFKGFLLIAVLTAVAVILLSVCIRAVKENDSEADVNIVSPTQEVIQTTVPSPTVQTTLPPVTETTTIVTEKDTTVPTTDSAASQTTTEAQQTEPAGPAALTDKEVLDIVTKGINSLQSDTASFTGTKTQVIYIQLNDCSVPMLTGTVNKVLEFFAGEEVLVYDFTNGKAIDPEEGVEVSTIHMIPPTDKLFTLTVDGVADTSVTKNEKGTVYSVTVVPETSTLENPRPPHHNAAGDTLDFSAFELPLGEVTKADFSYPGATVSITVDESGKVVEYHERLEMSGFGEGAALGITASGDMEGYIDEHWAIQWK